MQKRRIYFILVLAAILALALGALFISQQKAQSQSQVGYGNVPTTPVISTDANQKFSAKILLGETQEINRGLTVERLNVVTLKGISSPSDNHISLLVLNHTEEPIEFENVGFGIQVFEYDTSSSQWSKVTLPYTPELKKKIVPAKLEDFDFDVLNYWELTEKDLSNSKTGNVRILITGRGQNTNKKYYAFTDIALQK
jgi:hypothetical protein